MSQEQAVEFFRQLGVFSDRFVKKYCGFASALSPWGSSQFHKFGPLGAIIHYTADSDILRVLRWFIDPKHESKCSAHVVVAPNKMEGCAQLCADLPLIDELPVTVVQTRSPKQNAWHATWCNSSCYGLENVNAGEVRVGSDGGGWVSWRPRDKSASDWTKAWGGEDPKVENRLGRYWECYPPDQIAANIAVLRYVRDYFGSTLQLPCVIGHEGVQGRDTRRNKGSPEVMGRDKRDPGPMYPIHEVRSAVFDNWVPVTRYPWFSRLSLEGESRSRVALMVIRAVTQYAEAGVCGDGGVTPCSYTAWVRYRSALKALNGDNFGVWGKLSLWLLGYYVSGFDDDYLEPELDMYDRHSVWLFQRLMGIPTDGYPGKITCAAIRKRLYDRGVAKE